MLVKQHLCPDRIPQPPSQSRTQSQQGMLQDHEDQILRGQQQDCGSQSVSPPDHMSRGGIQQAK